MMVSKNPVEDRALKVTAGTMIVMVVTLTCLRACQFLAHKSSWCGPFAIFSVQDRALLDDHFRRVERSHAQQR